MIADDEDSNIHDLLVVGGGINGVGIACDAAGRGLSVLLCEASDLAGATSSASSKLIHGGLRYLEHYEFGLVRGALKEREILMAKAPHLVHPLRFILPHVREMRPAWMLRAGLFLYDHLYQREKIPGSGGISLTSGAAGEPLTETLTSGFFYWDCATDDARLVVLNARAAADLGADILVRTEVVGGEQEGDAWRVSLKDVESGTTREVKARALVNAAGPWVNDISGRFSGPASYPDESTKSVRLVKGSHIVVPRITPGSDAYILQNDDQRVVFVLPFEQNFTLIGTTDVSYTGNAVEASLDENEKAYLLEVVARFFRLSPSAEDIVWSFSGVRPLFDDDENDPSKLSRDYKLELVNENGHPPFLSVLGGKITTYRKLSEQAVDLLAPVFPHMKKAWTASHKLPGGDLIGGSATSHFEHLCVIYPRLDREVLAVLNRRHGGLTEEVLGDCKNISDLGEHLGGSLYEQELLHMKSREWARKPDDVLWRRSKTGLHMSTIERKRV